MRTVTLPLCLVALVSCSSSSSSSSGSSGADSGPPPANKIYVLNGTNEDLNIYDVRQGFKKRVAFSGNSDEGRSDIPALNGQICYDAAKKQLVMGDDGGQADPKIPAGWALMQLNGSSIDDFSITRTNKLVPTFQTNASGTENYGCAYLKDGRILTTDVGNQETGPGNGQLVIYFPPFDTVSGLLSQTAHFCKIDVTIGTAGGIALDDQERIYVASARVDPGVYRYTGPFPTGDDAAHGCGKKDPIGSPLADAVQREKFIVADNSVSTPTSIARSPKKTWYVASVLTGVIAEYDDSGKFVRKVLQPTAGAQLPYATGNPQGIGVDSDGSIYYADISLIIKPGGIDINTNGGSVRRIRFVDGQPQPPETMDTGLNFPDGIGVIEQ
jgi:hypothetical protein